MSLLDVLDEFEPRVAEAFLESFEDIRSGVRLNSLERALRRGDIDGALAILDVDARYFEPLREALREAYVREGTLSIRDIEGLREVEGGPRVRFSGTNPAAEAAIRNFAGNLVVGIVADEIVKLRLILTAAMNRGENPRSVALDIVGRYDRQAGRRVGGLLGLTPAQATWAGNALEELTSGDPARLRNYLKRETRDRRFDSIVERAIRDEKPVTFAKAKKMVARMEDRLLKLRGEAIARTELLGALHLAQDQAIRQMVDSGTVPADAVRTVWDATGDGRTRNSHRQMDGQTRPWGEPFVTPPPTSARLLFPGDTALGAPPEEVINCRCFRRVEIDFERMR